MPRNVVLMVAILLALSLANISGATAMPKNTINILPEDCRVLAGEEIFLSLDGAIPADAMILWQVDQGGITAVLPGTNAVFVAPAKSTVVTVSVSIAPMAPGMEEPITRQCIVSSPNQAPRGLAGTTGSQAVNLFSPWAVYGEFIPAG